MSEQRGILAAGVVAGLMCGAALSYFTDKSTSSAGSLPQSVPAGAVWGQDVFGAPRWIHCAADAKIVCKAYSRDGVLELSASYVPRGDEEPAAPFDDIIAREVGKVWLNKVAMVADGPVEFAVDGKSVEYGEGSRRGDP